MQMISEQNMEVAKEDISTIDEELRRAHSLGRARHGDMTIYTFDGSRCPVLMRRVLSLRAQSFGAVGVMGDEMSGVERVDIDGTYRQLIVWDNEAWDVVGGYRYAVGRDVVPEQLSLWRYYRLSSRFMGDYLPYCLELGRSFVALRYQSGGVVGSIYALDALWEGLAKVVERCGVKYLVGRVTLYPSMSVDARDLLVGFMRYAYPADGPLIVAREPQRIGIGRRRFSEIFVGSTLRDNYKILLSCMRSMRCMIPPIISSYMRLSPSLQVFDAYQNHDLGDVVEMGIMLTVADIYEDVKRRYFSDEVV